MTGPIPRAVARRPGCFLKGAHMNRTFLLNSPFLLGFEHMETLLERAAKTASDSYPPYNVEQTGERALRITLAVAGFSPEELEVTVEGRQLIVRGKQSEGDGKTYLHRGIAARQFQRAFVLADGIDVSGASLANGLLAIDMVRPPVSPEVRSIAIKTPPGAKALAQKGEV